MVKTLFRRLLVAVLVANVGLLFSVTGAQAAARPAHGNDDEQNIDVVAFDFGFEGAPEGTLDAGLLTIHLSNASSSEPHEMGFVKVNPELKHVTKAQAIAGIDAAFFNRPPDLSFFDTSAPGFFVGGVQPVDPGMSGDGVANLTRPGTYVYACIEFDKESGKFHYQLGMLGVFRVK